MAIFILSLSLSLSISIYLSIYVSIYLYIYSISYAIGNCKFCYSIRLSADWSFICLICTSFFPYAVWRDRICSLWLAFFTLMYMAILLLLV